MKLWRLICVRRTRARVSGRSIPRSSRFNAPAIVETIAEGRLPGSPFSFLPSAPPCWECRLSAGSSRNCWKRRWTALFDVVPALPAKVLLLSAFGYLVYFCIVGVADDYGPLPLPSGQIYEWLAAQGKSDLLYWHAIYWSHAKIQAHRREVLGFVFWRKSPLPGLFQERVTAFDPLVPPRPDSLE